MGISLLDVGFANPAQWLWRGNFIHFFRGAVRPLMTHECHSNDPLCEATLACPRAQGSHFSGGGTGQEGGESSGKDHF